MKHLTYFFIFIQLALCYKSYSENINTIYNKPLKWTVLEKNNKKFEQNNLKWEILREEDLIDIFNDKKNNFYFEEEKRDLKNIQKNTSEIKEKQSNMPLNNFFNNQFLYLGGLTVNNALIPKEGSNHLSLDYDDLGNVFTFYGHSISDIFQLEITTKSFNDINLADNKNSDLQNSYLVKNNFYYRFGGKLAIFSPEKGNNFWTSLRTSLGINEGMQNQGYVFAELINTLSLNNSLYLNLSPKYFFSGSESFGGLGVSTQIKILDNLQIIPEINTSFKNDPDFNSSLALRYIYKPQKSIDFYYSNAVGIQDIGQLLEAQEHRFGIKLNFNY